ncbi:phosphoribosylaminoimidazolesuccinocarboxamide synthase [Immundisolibacter sp.]|uniref:phosphoribosylaminoimidazolesuccinocarboxamide synthase n=1 Tax=Immundisolibacter sp. TaxID=1934948 RepID=UPI00261EF70F|nr:phosphoribosylaminoimidazolesuccinocarboxamide synthase [Immundisolibacter sp.]MDD3650619.1 phosphoribosylaminoimidazolesuccinocarboxamide synthase [Immundisolibacter sp.]
MSYPHGAELYRGKAKTVYATDDADLLLMHFRDDTSAFDGEKKAALKRKGMVNNHINAFIMTRLAQAGVPTHFVRLVGPQECLVRRLDMVPVECVVRNVAAGSLVRRLGVTEGQLLDPPLYELFLKNDALHDPMISEDHALAFGWASAADLKRMRELSLKVNAVLKPLFAAAGITLVDYKLEFGHHGGELLLGDEFTPDGCRLWDAGSGERLDKDRFRRDLGGVVEAYEEVARRLGVDLPEAG